MFLFGAPGGGTSLWGSGGLGLTCQDATYDNDNFDLLAHTQGLFTLQSPVTVQGGLLLVPDADQANTGPAAIHSSFTTGVLDYAIEAVCNVLTTPGSATFGPGLFSLYSPGVVEIYGPDLDFLSDTQIRIDYSGAGLFETITVVPNVPYTFTFKVARTAGVNNVYKDGVLKYSFANATNFTPRLICGTVLSGINLAKLRWASWQFAKC